nr:ORF75 formyl-glycinamide-phosphoribosyl-amidotransferase (FGARAT)-like tegument protein [Ovine gammaherpesvirus 2]
MSLYLLPNIRRVFKQSITKAWFSNTDYSIEEEQVLAKYLDNPGEVSIISGTVTSESILIVTVDTNEDAATSGMSYDEVFTTIQSLLYPLIKSTDPTPVSKNPMRRRMMKILYGPDLKRIPTTFSQEMVALLGTLNLRQVLRVDLGRCFSFISLYEPSDLTSELIIGDLKHPYTEIIYPEDLTSIPVNPEVIHYASDIIQLTGNDDRICKYVMKKAGAQVPLAQQVAHLPNISIPSTSVATSLSFKIRAALNLTKEMSSFHYAILQCSSNLGYISQQLDTLRMQRSIFVENSGLGGCLGAYVTSEQFNNKLSFEEMRELHSSLMVQSGSAARAGVPLVCGFSRFLFSTDESQLKLFKPMLYECYLASAIGTNLTSAAYGPGNILVALGSYSPAVADDTAPYYYRDSVLDYNKVTQTLNAFYSSIASPCVSSSLRDLGRRTVREHLFALLRNGGVNLYVSGLPEVLVYQLKHISEEEWGQSLEQLLDVYFFDTYSNLLFLTLTNEKIYNNLGQQFRPLDILQQVARLYGCTVHILGETVPDTGIHVWNDLATPFDYTAKHHKGVKKYSIHQYSEEPRPLTSRQDTDPDLECTVIAPSFNWAEGFVLNECVQNILLNPTVGSKSYIVHHMDRCGNGLVVQQPGVGPFDLPLADYGLVLHSLVKPSSKPDEGSDSISRWSSMSISELLKVNDPSVHENMPATCLALGEQALRIASAPVEGAIWAIAELLTNLMLGPRISLENLIITASATWDPTGNPEELKQTLLACKAYAQELNANFVVSSASSSAPPDSRYLDSHPEGKPLKFFKNIVFSGACKVTSLHRTVPVLQKPGNALVHLSINPAWGLTGSVFESLYGLKLGTVEKIPAPKLAALFSIVQEYIEADRVVSGHDISDGGFVASLLELCFSTEYTVRITLPPEYQPVAYLFSEAPGAVLELDIHHLPSLLARCQKAGIYCKEIGYISTSEKGALSLSHRGKVIFEQQIASLRSTWSHHSDTLFAKFSNDLEEDSMYKHDYGANEVDFGDLRQQLLDNYVAFYHSPDIRSKVAVLTWPGMVKEESLTWAFTNSQFDVYTVCVQEINDPKFLDEFRGLAIGSGSGCMDPQLAAGAAVKALLEAPGYNVVLSALLRFFKRPNTFSLGCGEFGFIVASQFIHNLNSAAPGPSTSHSKLQLTPFTLEKNKSGVYESRWLSVRVSESSPSIMLTPCRGMVLPCWVQGTYLGLSYSADGVEHSLFQTNTVACSYHGQSKTPEAFARHYPRNPSGNSSVAGLCSNDGRHLALLFDPSLAFFPFQWQHLPPEYKQLKTSPWSLLFYQMHNWCLS